MVRNYLERDEQRDAVDAFLDLKAMASPQQLVARSRIRAEFTCTGWLSRPGPRRTYFERNYSEAR
jgi:hypothetical protein